MNASKKGILKGGELHTNPVGTIIPSPNLHNKSRLGPSQWTWMWSRSREKARASRGRTMGRKRHHESKEPWRWEVLQLWQEGTLGKGLQGTTKGERGWMAGTDQCD